MTLDDNRRVEILADKCAELVNNFKEENKEELSVEFTALFNNAIKYVTPLEFTKAICELTKGTNHD